MPFKEGDKVRTNKEWNTTNEPIQGIVKAVKTLKCSMHKQTCNPWGEPTFDVIPGQFKYFTVLQIEGTERELVESWFEKVE